MANTINIPIEILTKEALAEIKNFSKEATKSLNIVNKATKEQNKILEETNNNVKILTSNQKTLGSTLGIVVATLTLQSKNVRTLIANIIGLNVEALKANKVFSAIGSRLKSTVKITGSLAEAAVILDKGLVGLSINLSTASLAFLGIGKAAETVDNDFINLLARISLMASLITGSLSIALIFLIRALSDLSVKLGTELVKAAKTATETFVEFDKKTFVFNRTIKGFNRAFGDSIGTVESWNESVKEISDTTGFTEKALRGAVTEIVATTSALGFNEKQQRKLLDVTTDYASFLGDDVVQTTIEFISALNGQAQSVQKYGVKLGQANIKQKLFSKGLNVNFDDLSETQKVQLRFNSLLEQYVPIAGNAAALTTTLAGQQKVLNNNVTRLAQSFGKGAAIIENNNLVAASFNLILNNINESVVATIGFFTSLIGRTLQIGGVILGASFNVLALIKGIKILNILLESDMVQALTNVPIPFFNRSLIDLIRTSGATFVSFKSLGDILKTFASIMWNQAKIVVAGLTGVEVSALTLSSVLKGAFVQALTAAKVAVTFLSKSLLKLLANPVVLTVTAIAGAVYALVKAFQFIEERTGVLTDLWNILNEVLLETSDIFKPILNLFTNFAKLIKTVINKALGGLIVALSKILSFGISLLKKNPFKIFSNDQIKKLENSKTKLDQLSQNLIDLDFNIANLKKTTERSIAGVNSSFKKIDLGPLRLLQDELKDVGLTDLQKLKQQRNERLKIIQDGLKSEGEAYRIAKELETKIEQDYQAQLKDIRDKEKADREAEETKRLEFIENYKKSYTEIAKEVTGILAKIGQTATNALQFAFGGGKEELLSDLDKQAEELSANFKAGRIGLEEFELEKSNIKKQRKKIEDMTQLGIATGLINGIAQGKEGARKAIVGISQGILDAWIPGLGQALGPLINAFTQGPEHVREMVNQFADAIPILIENIILSIPVIIEAIADKADVIIERLVERVDDIIIALIRAMPRVAVKLAAAVAVEVPLALSKSIGGVAWNFAKWIYEGFKKLFTSLEIFGQFWNLGKTIFRGFWSIIRYFGEFMFQLGKAIYRGLWDGIKDLGEFFYDLGKSIVQGFLDGLDLIGSGISSAAQSVGLPGGSGGITGSETIDTALTGGLNQVFGWAKGGLVPSGFSNDNFPARLTSGELVVDRSTTEDLQEFLATQRPGSAGNETMLGILGQILNTLQKGNIIQTSVEFNGDTLADIILDLNRNNARLA